MGLNTCNFKINSSTLGELESNRKLEFPPLEREHNNQQVEIPHRGSSLKNAWSIQKGDSFTNLRTNAGRPTLRSSPKWFQVTSHSKSMHTLLTSTHLSPTFCYRPPSPTHSWQESIQSDTTSMTLCKLPQQGPAPLQRDSCPVKKGNNHTH